MSLFAMYDYYRILNLIGTAHEREVYPFGIGEVALRPPFELSDLGW